MFKKVIAILFMVLLIPLSSFAGRAAVAPQPVTISNTTTGWTLVPGTGTSSSPISAVLVSCNLGTETILYATQNSPTAWGTWPSATYGTLYIPITSPDSRNGVTGIYLAKTVTAGSSAVSVIVIK